MESSSSDEEESLREIDVDNKKDVYKKNSFSFTGLSRDLHFAKKRTHKRSFSMPDSKLVVTEAPLVDHSTLEPPFIKSVHEALEYVVKNFADEERKKQIQQRTEEILQSLHNRIRGYTDATVIREDFVQCRMTLYTNWMTATAELYQQTSTETAISTGVVLDNLKVASKILFGNLSSFSEFVDEDMSPSSLKKTNSQLYLNELKDIEEPDEELSIDMVGRQSKISPYALHEDDPEVFTKRHPCQKQLDKLRSYRWGWSLVREWMHTFLPVTDWLPKYTRSDLQRDVIAGLTIGVMIIPQAMAYAYLAGLPPIYGLYNAFLPPLLYVWLGTSPTLAVGPLAIMGLLVSQTVSALHPTSTAEYVSYCISLACIVGLLYLTLGILRLGFLFNFLSRPVLSGYTSAASILIIVSQLKFIFGVTVPNTSLFHDTLREIIIRLGDTQIAAFLVGCIGLTVLLVFKHWKLVSTVPRTSIPFPATLLLVVVATTLGYLIEIDQYGVGVVGDIPSGLPAPRLPTMNGAVLQKLLVGALPIGMAGIIESFSITKVTLDKRGGQLNANQELIALGTANLIGSFFQSFPLSGAFGRTAVNNAAGARTQVSGFIGAMVVMLTLLFLTPAFYYLPQAILAAIVMVAVFGLINYEEPIILWKSNKADCGMLLIAFFLTLFLGVQTGILTAVIVSLVHQIFLTSRPHIAILGRIPGTVMYRNIARFPEAVTVPGIVVFRFDAPIFFGNVEYFKKKLLSVKELLLSHQEVPVRALIIDADPVNNIDSTALYELKKLCIEFSKKDIIVCFAGVKGRALGALYRAGVLQLLGKSHFFHRVHDAFLAVSNKKITHEVYQEAMQNHVKIDISLSCCTKRDMQEVVSDPNSTRESRAASVEAYEVNTDKGVQ